MKQCGKALDIMLYMVVATVILMGALGAVNALINPPRPSLETSPQTDVGMLERLGEPFPGRGRITVLLLGSDEVEGVSRSDTIMVLFLNPMLSRAALLSIPRDSRVEIPGHGMSKINHAFAWGGVELAQVTVEKFLGIDIDYHAHIGFDAFVETVNELGGVDIDVPDLSGHGEGMVKHTYYDPINLKPGHQHLNGRQALQFVRYREDGDVERTRRQQQFMQAIADQKFSVWNIRRLIGAGGKLLNKLESNVDWWTAFDFMRVLRKIPASKIETAIVPIRNDATINGVSYCIVAESGLRDLVHDIEDHLSRTQLAGTTVHVLNGSGVVGLAAAAAQTLTEAGFQVARVGNADSFDYARSIVNYRPEAREAAGKIRQTLNVPRAELVQQRHWAGNFDMEVEVVVGQDFAAEKTTGSELH